MRLSWFYSKQPPLRNLSRQRVSLVAAGVSVECIRRGEETVVAWRFIIGQYCTEKLTPDIPVQGEGARNSGNVRTNELFEFV